MAILSPSLSKVEIKFSKIHAQRQLSGSIAALPRGLRRLQNAKRRRTANVAGRRREVGVIQSVGERRFKPESKSLPDWKDFRQPRRHRYRSRSFQYAHPRVSDSPGPGWSGSERVDVPEQIAADPRIGIPDRVRPRRDAAASNNAGIRLILGRTDRGSEIRPGLYQSDRVNIPSAQRSVNELVLALPAPAVAIR